MKRETITLKNGRIEVLIDGNLIYTNVFGEYTDNDVIELTQYLEKFLSLVDGPTIRVSDSRNVSDDGFKLTSKGTDDLANWSRMVKVKWPDSIVYLIADKPIKYGMSRMYQLKSSVDGSAVVVVQSINELPEDIQKRIAQA